MDGKWYVHTCSHGLVDGEIEEPLFGTEVGLKGEAEKLKDAVEIWQRRPTLT